MFVQIGLLAAGLVLLVKGADWFIDRASAIAEKLRIPQLIIGLTIVAMGTSAPEAAISISAALKDSADITIVILRKGRLSQALAWYCDVGRIYGILPDDSINVPVSIASNYKT